MAKTNKVAQVATSVTDAAEVEESVTPAKVLEKGTVTARTKSAFGTVQTATASHPDNVKFKMMKQISFYVYFLMRLFCENKKHAAKDVVEQDLLKCETTTLQEFRDYLFQNVSELVEKDGKTMRVLKEGVSPDWTDLPLSLQAFINEHIDSEYNLKMVAAMLTQACPEKYTGPVQNNTHGLYKILDNKPEVVSALIWWASVGYPNLSEITTEGKRVILQDMYDNKFNRAKWWGREGEYMQYVDRERSSFED